MSDTIFAANWKMHLGPAGARQFLTTFLEQYRRRPGREVWFFPSAVSLEAVAGAIRDRPEMFAGAQNVYWEPKGAFTGELSVAMAREAGADASLVGHSERRHVFGETVEETARKLRALLDGGLVPMLCVGERLEEREAGRTLAVVEDQLTALAGLDPETMARVVIAYEPVWAIGTGRTATPRDAADVHRGIRAWLISQGVDRDATRILYGGSVKPDNIGALVTESEIDGVLVGGASLDPLQWTAMVSAALD